VIGDESEGGDCDEAIICAGWGEPGGQWTEWGWRNEEGSWFHMHMWKSGWWLVTREIRMVELYIGWKETIEHFKTVM